MGYKILGEAKNFTEQATQTATKTGYNIIGKAVDFLETAPDPVQMLQETGSMNTMRWLLTQNWASSYKTAWPPILRCSCNMSIQTQMTHKTETEMMMTSGIFTALNSGIKR